MCRPRVNSASATYELAFSPFNNLTVATMDGLLVLPRATSQPVSTSHLLSLVSQQRSNSCLSLASSISPSLLVGFHQSTSLLQLFPPSTLNIPLIPHLFLSLYFYSVRQKTRRICGYALSPFHLLPSLLIHCQPVCCLPGHC